MTSAVLDEALKKAAVAWVSVGDGPALGIWCMPLEGSLIVVSGPGEQYAPGLADASRATVRLRGDNGGLIVVSDVAVTRLVPGSEEWATVAPQLAQKRLNASGTADEVVARWAETGCAVVRLTPSEQDVTTAPDLPADSGAAAPRETPARIETRRPYRLHRVRKN
ncbi:hypothetical protein ACQP2F_43210 [Actinoplanes sp. CA-030573]|uniref:hypothetical protein n=1 Tax=Actinoplanes sp. CA-030573 TaxID=3239898 RepID=UPI003D8D96CE